MPAVGRVGVAGEEEGVLQSHEIRIGSSYRCWVNTPIGRLRAKFVPTSTAAETVWGRVYIGRVFLDGVSKRSTDGNNVARYFADELEPWVP